MSNEGGGSGAEYADAGSAALTSVTDEVAISQMVDILKGMYLRGTGFPEGLSENLLVRVYTELAEEGERLPADLSEGMLAEIFADDENPSLPVAGFVSVVESVDPAEYVAVDAVQGSVESTVADLLDGTPGVTLEQLMQAYQVETSSRPRS